MFIPNFPMYFPPQSEYLHLIYFIHLKMLFLHTFSLIINEVDPVSMYLNAFFVNCHLFLIDLKCHTYYAEPYERIS